MGILQELAEELGVEERTLRRHAALGTLRSRRLSSRRLRIADGEREYLRTHWALLDELREGLRLRPPVRLAILYGSAARGDDGPGSDVDLLISTRDQDPLAPMEVRAWLEERLGRSVDVAELDRVERDAPLLLLQALDEGRVIIDRDAQWADLRKRRRAIRARADRQFQREMAETAEAMSRIQE